MAAGTVTPAVHSHPLNPPTAPSIVKVRMPAKRAVRALGVSGPLAFETDGRAAQRGDQEADEPGGVHFAVA